MARLDGKVAVVTGASQGIGKAIAEGLAAEGARIVVADLRDAEEAAAAHPDGVGLTVDVADEAAVSLMVEETVERFGGLDVLVNNAGIGIFKNAAEMSPAEWQSIIDTNLTGVFYYCHAAIPHLRRTQPQNVARRSWTLATARPTPRAVANMSHQLAYLGPGAELLCFECLVGLARHRVTSHPPVDVTCNLPRESSHG